MSGDSAGDIVIVKSGSPQLTVAKVDNFSGDISAVCIWFDGAKNTGVYVRV